MTSSARSSSEGGIVRPRALAVLRLMTSSNFVGRSIGNSAGLIDLLSCAAKDHLPSTLTHEGTKLCKLLLLSLENLVLPL
jgi:hypothetical protein